MNKDQTEGAAKQVRGSVKEAIGKVTGSDQTEVAGMAEKVAGKLQTKVGDLKEDFRRAGRK